MGRKNNLTRKEQGTVKRRGASKEFKNKLSHPSEVFFSNGYYFLYVGHIVIHENRRRSRWGEKVPGALVYFPVWALKTVYEVNRQAKVERHWSFNITCGVIQLSTVHVYVTFACGRSSAVLLCSFRFHFGCYKRHPSATTVNF